jgi:hypothetical protein
MHGTDRRHTPRMSIAIWASEKRQGVSGPCPKKTASFFCVSCLVLSCLIRATGWADAPRWGGRLRCWLAAPSPLPQPWTCSAVQIVTRVPLSLYLGPRLVNVVSLAYKILTANHVLIMQ